MSLPIEKILPQIAEELAKSHFLAIEASPGSGKTTAVPLSLLPTFSGKVLVLEPRRLAAMLAARRVADTLGEPLGQTVGLIMRQGSKVSPQSRLIFVTEGVLPQMILDDPSLKDVSCLIFDEFHERHLQTDVGFTLSRLVQKEKRPDLKIILMSATLGAEDLKAKFPDLHLLSLDAAPFPLELLHLPYSHENKDLPALVGHGLEKYVWNAAQYPGHILIFLPGEQDIRSTARYLQNSASAGGLQIISLMAATVDEALQEMTRPSTKRKVILATNVAESSVTLDGVQIVVDAGLAKIPTQDPWLGFTSLKLMEVSQSSLKQRSGRASRQMPGLCVRLFHEGNAKARRHQDLPEMERLGILQPLFLVLALCERLGCHPDTHLAIWPSSLNELSFTAAAELLERLGLITKDHRLTAFGKEYLRLPLHPRWMAVLRRGIELNFAAETALLVAILADAQAQKYLPESGFDCDAVGVLERFHREAPSHIKKTTEQQAAAFLQKLAIPASFSRLKPWHDVPFGEILLPGFFDRVGQMRETKNRSGARTALLAQGGEAMLSTESTVLGPWFVAWEGRLLQRSGTWVPEICRAAFLSSASLQQLEALPLYQKKAEHYWNEAEERVRARLLVTYGQITIKETLTPVDSEAAEPILRTALQKNFPRPFASDAPLIELKARLSLLVASGLLEKKAELEDDLELLFLQMVEGGKSSFAEVLSRSLDEYLEEILHPDTLRVLQKETPRFFVLPSGRRVPIHYELDKPPYLAARLQEFFGLKQTPRIASGRVALTLHLLAPNHRPLQVTQDLENFWTLTYPSLRNQYMRRYPRHAWPENPLLASPHKKNEKN